jgi:predicted NBD/HSP70 family sugar kinase
MLANVVGGPYKRLLESTDERDVLAQILNLIDDLRPLIAKDQRLLGLGLEIGGHVNQGRVIYSPNANWTQFPLAERLRSILRLPVVLENDANALAIYERRFTGIQDHSFAVIMLTEVGIGCGLMLRGQIYHGVGGMAGELGHVPVALGEQADSPCSCTNHGCVESQVTPHAIELSLPSYGFKGSYQEALRSSHLESVRRAFAAAGASFGRAIINVVNLINPSAIVLYGPPQLLGAPRDFHVEGKRTFHNEGDLPAGGVAHHYTMAMIEAIRQNSFSTGVSDCRFIVRSKADLHVAQAAAACLIDRVALAPSMQVETEAPSIIVMT